MITGLVQFALVVRDYDEAQEFYCEKLGFVVIEDTHLSEKRWLRLRAPGKQGADILISKAVTAAESAVIGNQAGGRVLFFLHTDNFEIDYQKLRKNGIEFTEDTRDEAYGKVAVFKDLYGNRIDLIQPKA
jgi:catechol 2,3-dioxygenase-like lactoylglutathione lyase family enzyme